MVAVAIIYFLNSFVNMATVHVCMISLFVECTSLKKDNNKVVIIYSQF